MIATLMKLRFCLALIAGAAGFTLAAAWFFGSSLSAPHQMAIGLPPVDLDAQVVMFPGKSGASLSGWFVPGQTGQGGVLLLHGIRSNRREMLGRAAFLHQAGYSVLLFDFQAHGESPGERITFGYLESQDAQAAFDYLQRRIPGQPIGVIGVSLGGAATLLGKAPLPADALVLESVFPDFEGAVANRIAIRLGSLGHYLAPLFVWQIRPRLGIDPKRLSPIDHISQVRAPVLIIAGTEDQRTTLAEARRLYDQAPEPKKFWPVPGAAHQNFHRYAPAQYEARVLKFFERFLGSNSHVEFK